MKISIVIPVKNEERNVNPLFHEIKRVMTDNSYNYEIIYVNDHSTDKTEKILKMLHDKERVLRYFNNSAKRGKDYALRFGFKMATGDRIITLDGDFQNRPSDIPKVVELLNKYDLVCGNRVLRYDRLSKRLGSFIATFFRSLFIKNIARDPGCGLKGFSKYASNILFKRKNVLFGFEHVFYGELAFCYGLNVKNVSVKHSSRHFGKTKYGFSLRFIIGGIFAVLKIRRLQKLT